MSDQNNENLQSSNTHEPTSADRTPKKNYRKFHWVFVVIAIFIVPILFAKICSMCHREIDPRYVCGANLRGLGQAITVYAVDYNGKLPTASRWCDLLLERADVSVSSFVCFQGSDALRGESSYAMNKYIADMNLAQVPADVVVLFETDSGRTAKRSKQVLCQLRSERFFSYEESNGVDTLKRTDKLDKLRWNQVGGQEILTTVHHAGGCNVLFGDGSLRFIKTDEITKLRWKP